MTPHTTAVSTATHTTTPDALQVTSRRRRVIEAVTFVAFWMAAGYALRLPSNGYLLLGVPLTAAFQVIVRRRPLRELFAAGTTRFALTRRGAALATLLAVVPAFSAIQALIERDLSLVGWYLAATVGAVAAAFSLRATTLLATLRSAAVPIAIGSGGMATVFGILHVATGTPLPAVAALVALVKYTALYFPATFLLEEVAFRGAIDAHVHHDGDGRGGSRPSSSPLSGVCGIFPSPRDSRCRSWSRSLPWSTSPWGCRCRSPGAAPATSLLPRWLTP